MSKLPVIVGMGGVNAAGRSANFHSYKRMISQSLSGSQMQDTWRDLALSMGLISERQPLNDEIIEQVIAGTLIRRIDAFDPDAVEVNTKVADHSDGESSILKPMNTPMAVTSAGCVPNGMDVGRLYKSRNHPKGLQLTVFGASDLLNSLGLSWQQIINSVGPDEVAVYAGSGLGQIDDHSLGGLVGSPLKGKRTSSKMLPLSMPQMPADFINSYVINSVGSTGASVGACASYLYNLRQGVIDIQTGRARVAIVGSAEAPVTPSIIEGFRVMGALAEDHQLRKLDGDVEQVDNRRACRPFSSNAGFTIAESAQFVMLMDDELALELGANILGAIPDVFINADANKKSISAPGIGNYVTMAKAAALANGILGPEGLKQTYVSAHGTGTPQNRVTESHIFNEVAKTYDIENWAVTSIKSYVGHSIGAAAGDQLCAALGVWQFGYIPGIKTIEHIAADVNDSNLEILMEDKFVGEKGEQMKAAIINSKGFGGNNASALVLSPEQTMAMLTKKHGDEKLAEYRHAHDQMLTACYVKSEQQQEPDGVIYQFGEDVMDASGVSLTPDSVSLASFTNKITLPDGSAFGDYL